MRLRLDYQERGEIRVVTFQLATNGLTCYSLFSRIAPRFRSTIKTTLRADPVSDIPVQIPHSSLDEAGHSDTCKSIRYHGLYYNPLFRFGRVMAAFMLAGVVQTSR